MNTEINKRKNIKLFPLYLMFGEDFVFLYAIEFVFLISVKHFEAADVLLVDALIPLFQVLTNVPCTVAINRLGKRKSVIIGNIFMCIFLLALIFGSNVYIILACTIFNAIGFNLKKMTESNILADSINMHEKNGRFFYSTIYSTGYRNYLILDGITSFFTGLTFMINGYMPIVISLALMVVATIVSFFFKPTSEDEIKKLKGEKKQSKKIGVFKEYKLEFVKLFKDFKKIVLSGRMRAFLLLVFLLSGLILGMYSVRETLLTDYFAVDATTFAIILSGWTLIGCFEDHIQEWLAKRFKNRTISFIAYSFLIITILAGVVCLSGIPTNAKLIACVIMFAGQYVLHSAYDVLMISYSKNFTTKELRVKISACYEFVRNISSFLIALLFSFLIRNVDIIPSILIIGGGFMVLLLLANIYINKHFGLKPSKYDKKDVFEK